MKYKVGDLIFDQNKFTKYKMIHLIINISEEDETYSCLLFQFKSNKIINIEHSNIVYTSLDKDVNNLKTQVYRVKNEI